MKKSKKPIDDAALVNARRACLVMLPFAKGQGTVIILGEHERAMVYDLLNQFARLDKKEQRQRSAGKKGAAHGSKGGRPRKSESLSAPENRDESPQK